MQITNEIENYIENGKLNLERIVKDFTPYIKAIINNIVDNNLSYEDKEEIITDAFFILWKNQNKLTTSVKAYLAGITKNLIKEKLNKKVITYDISDYENSIIYIEIIKIFFSLLGYIYSLVFLLNKQIKLLRI